MKSILDITRVKDPVLSKSHNQILMNEHILSKDLHNTQLQNFKHLNEKINKLSNKYVSRSTNISDNSEDDPFRIKSSLLSLVSTKLELKSRRNQEETQRQTKKLDLISRNTSIKRKKLILI